VFDAIVDENRSRREKERDCINLLSISGAAGEEKRRDLVA
jgi:hypothetical protein